MTKRKISEVSPEACWRLRDLGRLSSFDLVIPFEQLTIQIATMPEKLPPIASLLQEPLPPNTQYHRPYESHTPAPRSQHSFPEAQSLAPAPLGHRPNYSATASSDYSNHGRDPRLMYGNGESAYPRSAGGSPSSTSQYSAGYDNRPQPQDYMGQYVGRPQSQSHDNRASDSAGYPLTIEQVGGDYSDGKQKRRRGNLPKHVTDILRNWFQEHVAHPYPTEEEKQTLMSMTGLSLSQISNWFINARRRSLPQITRQAQTEADIRDGSMPLNH